MQWHKNDNKRQMPWKGEKDPYKVWLSEIILQQTRVEQGLAYYEKFISKFPTIELLAKAKDETVFKLWEGLGYYSRCKNVLLTARLIVKNLNGKFPSDYETILSLKGVGPYTAAAIASFCFNLPYAVVDGNVFRVLSRVSAKDTAIDTNEGKKFFTALAGELLDKKNPGAFNQAIMDFGATVCKPMLPLCSTCALQKICGAYKAGRVDALPVKEKRLIKKTRWFTYFVFEYDKKLLVNKRTANDIWQNLHEFYSVETEENPAWDLDKAKKWCSNLRIKYTNEIKIIAAQPQQLTHQTIKGFFIKIHLQSIPHFLKSGEMKWKTISSLQKIGFPKFITQYLKALSAKGF